MMRATREALTMMEGDIEFLADARKWASAVTEVGKAEAVIQAARALLELETGDTVDHWFRRHGNAIEALAAALRDLDGQATGESGIDEL